MKPHLRIARPVSALERSVAMYSKGLGLIEIGRFENHEGFDGVMLGRVGLGYHFEFTYCRTHPVEPRPTPEDLVVFYLPDHAEWQRTCQSMLEAGFKEVAPFNSYWQQRGRTFEDHDRFRVVLSRLSGRADWARTRGLSLITREQREQGNDRQKIRRAFREGMDRFVEQP